MEESFYTRALSLPLHPSITEEDTKTIIKTVIELSD